MVWGSHKTLRYWHHQLELSSAIIISHSHIRKVSTKALFVVTDFRTHILDHRDMCFRSPIWIILKYHVNVFWELLLIQSPSLFLNNILKNLKNWLSEEIVHWTFNYTSITIQSIHIKIVYRATCLKDGIFLIIIFSYSLSRYTWQEVLIFGKNKYFLSPPRYAWPLAS